MEIFFAIKKYYSLFEFYNYGVKWSGQGETLRINVFVFSMDSVTGHKQIKTTVKLKYCLSFWKHSGLWTKWQKDMFDFIEAQITVINATHENERGPKEVTDLAIAAIIFIPHLKHQLFFLEYAQGQGFVPVVNDS